VVCLGYPLCGMGRRDKMRDEVLRSMTTPVLFVQGTRDKLCPLDLLESVRSEMAVPSAVHVVETGDHSLQLTKTHTKKTGQTQQEADTLALAAVEAFVQR